MRKCQSLLEAAGFMERLVIAKPGMFKYTAKCILSYDI